MRTRVVDRVFVWRRTIRIDVSKGSFERPWRVDIESYVARVKVGLKPNSGRPSLRFTALISDLVWEVRKTNDKTQDID